VSSPSAHVSRASARKHGDHHRDRVARARRARVADSAARDDITRIREFYDSTATDYDQWLGYYERWMKLGEGRRRLLSRARGRTLEVGVGTGVNLPHYPPDVQLTAVDLSPGMLELARNRAQRLGLNVDLRIADAHQLGFDDDHFDTVVVTLVLSTVPACRRAATEIHRVLKPGGRLLVLDHVRSPIAPVRWIQRTIEPLVASYAGWHLTRDPLDYVESTGFTVESCSRSRLGMIEELVARKN
jgi:ubiquinone/menaquinone biosynthesis C-methylase UbiE